MRLLDQTFNQGHSSIRRRVADALLRLHAQAGTEGRIPRATTWPPSSHGPPESVIRTRSEFSQDELIELSSKTIRVREPDKLRRARW